jgi:hypothetical protein
LPILAFNTSVYSPAAFRAVPRKRKRQYFYCGRAAPSKNLAALKEAWVAGAFGELQLYGPPELEKYEYSAKVRYRGCYTARLPFMTGDIVIIPSFREGHSNVLVEAFLSGALVLGTAIPGVEEHLAEDRGVLIERPFDALSIARSVGTAINMPEDRYQETIDRARAYAQHWFARDTSSIAQVVAEAIKRK